MAGLDLRCGVWTLQLRCVGSVVAAHGLQSAWASVVAVPGLSCSAARGIFPDQGSNLCPCIGRWIPNCWTTREVPGKTVKGLETSSGARTEPRG